MGVILMDTEEVKPGRQVPSVGPSIVLSLEKLASQADGAGMGPAADLLRSVACAIDQGFTEEAQELIGPLAAEKIREIRRADDVSDERYILGAILLNNSVITEVLSMSRRDFGPWKHWLIFLAMLRGWEDT